MVCVFLTVSLLLAPFNSPHGVRSMEQHYRRGIPLSTNGASSSETVRSAAINDQSVARPFGRAFHGPDGHVIGHGRAIGLGEGCALPNGRATDHPAWATHHPGRGPGSVLSFHMKVAVDERILLMSVT